MPVWLSRLRSRQAARLCDEVLPVAPMRQYVLSLPHALRYLLAWDHPLLSEVLAIWAREIERGLLLRAARELGDAAVLRAGAAAGFTGIQRWG